MYFVIGNSPKKVELKDLNDCIYYKQQKVYTDDQYKRSIDLQRAIERKVLIVLKKSEDKTGSFDLNTTVIPSEIKITESSSPKIDLLLERIQNLEKSIKNKEVSGNTDVLSAILDRLEKLEKNPVSADISSIQDMLKTIESKIQDNRSDGILDKLESILNRSPGSMPTVKEEETKRVEEIYVPNIQVEDAKSHINLQIRTVDTGDSVSDALSKLKKIKSKSK